MHCQYYFLTACLSMRDFTRRNECRTFIFRLQQTKNYNLLHNTLMIAALLTVMISCKKADPGSQAASSNDSIILANDIYQRATRYKGSGNDSLRWYASRLIRLGEAQGNDRVIVNGLRLKANYEW